RDLNRRVVDLRKRRHRELAKRDDARQEHADHQQRRRDRPEDERARWIHRLVLPLVATAPDFPRSRVRASSLSDRVAPTRLPACSRSTPCVTTISAGRIPATTSERSSSTVPSVTFRIATDWSGFTT